MRVLARCAAGSTTRVTASRHTQRADGSADECACPPRRCSCPRVGESLDAPQTGPRMRGDRVGTPPCSSLYRAYASPLHSPEHRDARWDHPRRPRTVSICPLARASPIAPGTANHAPKRREQRAIAAAKDCARGRAALLGCGELPEALAGLASGCAPFRATARSRRPRHRHVTHSMLCCSCYRRRSRRWPAGCDASGAPPPERPRSEAEPAALAAGVRNGRGHALTESLRFVAAPGGRS